MVDSHHRQLLRYARICYWFSMVFCFVLLCGLLFGWFGFVLFFLRKYDLI